MSPPVFMLPQWAHHVHRFLSGRHWAKIHWTKNQINIRKSAVAAIWSHVYHNYSYTDSGLWHRQVGSYQRQVVSLYVYQVINLDGNRCQVSFYFHLFHLNWLCRNANICQMDQFRQTMIIYSWQRDIFMTCVTIMTEMNIAKVITFHLLICNHLMTEFIYLPSH